MKSKYNGCKLTELTIPQSVTTIGDYAFLNNLLQRVVIPNGVETIGTCAFDMITLKSIVIGVGVKLIGSQSTTIPKTIWLPNIPPQGSESFRSFVHYVANDLKYLEFGINVKHIGEEAFSDCNQVTTILSHAAVPPVCDNQALADINAFTCRLLVPTGSTTAYSKAPQWELFLPEEFLTGLKTMNINFTFSIEATAGQCCLTPVAGNTRNDCLVEVVDMAGRTLTKANWRAGVSQLSLPVAVRSGAIIIVKIQDVKDGRQLVKCIQLK